MGSILKPTNVIKVDLGIDSNGRLQKFITSECAKIMDKYVPFDKGNLADYKISGNYIIYDQLYAEYQYYGISKSGKNLKYHKDKHLYAGPYWDKRMWSAQKQDVINAAQNYLGGM